MASLFGLLRRKIFAPTLRSVCFDERGFPGATARSAAQLELIPQSVVCGFEWGMETTDLWELERRLTTVDAELRGFAYEGATMAWTILDTMPGSRRARTPGLLLGPGSEHIFLAYIGIGFAMARLPRPLWKKVLPELPGQPYHPTMSWLAVDGYGFDRAYFDTHRWVDQQIRPDPYPFQGAPEYFPRAFDQGVGRALWFIHGGRSEKVAEAVSAFAGDRHGDLFSGVGLAATFAGGCAQEGLAELARLAGPHSPDLALGAAFAAKARVYAGFVPAHTELAVRAFADAGVAEVVTIADETEVTDGDSALPAYELWRNRIRTRLAALPSKA